MTPVRADERVPLLPLVAAFAAVYVIWGSTYLAIRFAIETMPPFLMAAVRFLVAGAVLYAWSRGKGAPAPARANWLAAAGVGGLMLLGGNGGVVWAEQRVDSGLASLIITTVPFWMVLLDWLRPRGVRPTAMTVTGLAAGFVGVALLVGGAPGSEGHGVDRAGALVLILAALSWSFGSLWSRSAPLPKSPWLSTSMQMLAGGALLLVLSLATGEASRVDLAGVSWRSVLSLLYLVIFGSLVAFSAYVWLLRNATAAAVSTYAFVNPVVAVFLGWAMAGEEVTSRTLLAAAIIIGAVVVITVGRTRTRRRLEAASAAAAATEA
jgi:drug/metabolite transporter (DMT)-like permease